MKYWNNNELRLTQPNSTTKQHDKTASLCLIILIENLVLRVNTTKQHDVTTRRYDNVLFDHFQLTPSNQPTSIIPIQPAVITAQQPHFSHHYRCKITTESRKVLYIKNPQHYFFEAADQFPHNLFKINNLNKTSSTCFNRSSPAALILLARFECFKRCLTFG